jgi:glycosyltransferase involved in cell wall biosynthesis
VPASDGAAWRRELADRSHVLFVGRFDELKGGDLMLLAFRSLALRNPGLRLTLVEPDSGVEHAGRHVKLREYVAALIPKSVAERIEYCGVLPEAAIRKLGSEAFVTVVASRYDNFPNTVLEAMAFGCSLVAIAVGGIPELLQNEHNGLLVLPGAPELIALACERLPSDPPIASKLAAQARADCSARYDPRRIAEETLGAYQAAIDAFPAISPHG